MESKTLGAIIRARREEMGLTQTDLADKAGVGRGYLAQVETGRISLPTVDFRRRIASALGVRHLDLLVAAGELSPDEIGDQAAAPVHPFLAMIERLPSHERQALWTVIEGLVKGFPERDDDDEEEAEARRADEWIMTPGPRPRTPGR